MSFSNDIIIKDSESLFYFKYLEWDSDFFKKESFLLDVEKSNLIPTQKIKEKIKEKFQNSFISVKLNTNLDYKITFFLQECGFYYVDTEVTLELSKLKEQNTTKENIKIENLTINENLPYKELGSAFSLTRFHADLNIDNSLANLLWINYIKNYKPSNNKYLFVAKINEEVAGVILVNTNDDKIANLFFVAVIDKYRGLGIGKELTSAVIIYFDKYHLTVGTQVKNINALNFYIKSGFSKIKQTSTVLHRWN